MDTNTETEYLTLFPFPKGYHQSYYPGGSISLSSRILRAYPPLGARVVGYVYLLLSPVAEMLRQMALIDPRKFNRSLAHLEEDPLDGTALHASLLLDHRVEQLSRGDPLNERKEAATEVTDSQRRSNEVVICNIVPLSTVKKS